MSRIFGPVRQNGYVVRDIEKAMTHWVEVMGVGPWYYIDRVQTDWFRHLQHLAFWSKNYQALYDEALRLGYQVGHEGQIGGDQGRFAYFDSAGHPGTVIEISDISGAKGTFFEHIRNVSADWDGADPIRPVSR